MTLQEAKIEAVARANATGKLWAVVVKEGAALGLLGNNRECEVVPFPSGPGRFNMGNYGPGALLD